MQVDFYQLERHPVERILPRIAARIMETGGRLLVVAADPELRQRLSHGLWQELPASFLAHGISDEGHAAIQPILLTDRCEAENGATHIALADGQWRPEALGFQRAFHFFDQGVIEAARDAWRSLIKTDGVEPRFWRQEGSRWSQVA